MGVLAEGGKAKEELTGHVRAWTTLGKRFLDEVF